MTLRVFLILFSLLGISSSFMPWIYIPRGDVYIYGYVGDGLITSFLFLISLIVLLFWKQKKALSNKLIIFLLFIYALLSIIAFFKIYNFNFNKNNYDEINFLISTVMVGTKQGIGIYVLFMSSLLSLLVTTSSYFSNKQISTTNFLNRKIVFSIVFIFLLVGIYFKFFNQPSSDKTESALKKDFQEMYLAFQTNDFDKFLSYIHPIIIEPLGAENYRSAIVGAREYLSIKNISIKAAGIDTVIFTHNSINNIQSLVKSRVTFVTPRGDSTVVQRTLCISEDSGKKWYYFNTTDKSFKEVKDNFPYLHEDLNDFFKK